ncbi:MAG: hypothetical protein AAB393_09390 [Bacteroidota bacterium]
MNPMFLGLGLLLLIGSILAFIRARRWGVAVQILGAALLLGGGIVGVFGPGDVVLDLPGHPAERQLRYLHIVGCMATGGLVTFVVGYFITEVTAFRRRKSEMK